MIKLAFIGAGAWGTALASVSQRNGHDTWLWTRRPELAQTISRTHENTAYLPGVQLAETLHVSSQLDEVTERASALFLVTPVQHLRTILTQLPPTSTPLVLCCKGIEIASGKFPAGIAAEIQPNAPIAILSGPTFASEVARGLPTAITLSTTDPDLGEQLAALIGNSHFRPYGSDDLIGAQIGGAIKNVIAIACGIIAGKALGENARAALVTRGLAEIARLAEALGGQPQTVQGLACLGDLMLTANSMQSRNFSLGHALGQGQTLAEILGNRHTVTEGVATARAASTLATKLAVNMPIVQAVAAIVDQGTPVETIITELLARPFRREH